MPRPPAVPGGRTVALHTRLSEAEAEDFDDRRGSVSRSEFLRYLIKKAVRDDTRYER